MINLKGGSGKSTTAGHLAQKLALDGDRVNGGAKSGHAAG